MSNHIMLVSCCVVSSLELYCRRDVTVPEPGLRTTQEVRQAGQLSSPQSGGFTMYYDYNGVRSIVASISCFAHWRDPQRSVWSSSALVTQPALLKQHRCFTSFYTPSVGGASYWGVIEVYDTLLITGARAKAWCLVIQAEVSLPLSLFTTR